MNNDAHHGEAEAAEPAPPTLDVTPDAPHDERHSAAEVSDAGASDVSAAASLLTLAQRLHDEHVAEGQNTRERLISEGQSHHDHVVSEATAKHDELLSTGQAAHDALVAEAEALVVAASSEHEHTITEARERSTRMVAEAQAERAEVLDRLSSERSVLQKEIEELRTFERDGRALLRSHLEGQLVELDQKGCVVRP